MILKKHEIKEKSISKDFERCSNKMSITAKKLALK
jgi:hypothetical protein